MANEDLLKDTSTVSEDGNFFILTITDLEPNISHPIELRWKYKDGSFSYWSAVKTLPIVDGRIAAKLPSTPTVKPVLGAIELSWDGKPAAGGRGYDTAKVYIGTSSTFTPADFGTSKPNQVDVLDFVNGKNTINIGLDTVFYESSSSTSSSVVDYGINYYVKIVATNLTDSAPVLAVPYGGTSGQPIQVGTVSSNGIVSVVADKIITGTINAEASIKVGSTSGKHVRISGGNNLLSMYGSGGYDSNSPATNRIFNFASDGDLEITGTIYATGGSFGKENDTMKIGWDVNTIDNTQYHGIYMGTHNYWYNTGSFKVGNETQYVEWDETSLNVQGTFNTGTWKIHGDTIANVSLGDEVTINFGSSTIIQRTSGLELSSYGAKILRVEELTDRVILGERTVRKVEVAESAQTSSSNDKLSGGLRNMYTTKDTWYAGHTTVYLTDGTDGDVLLVYSD